jgi:hypothetical protein
MRVRDPGWKKVGSGSATLIYIDNVAKSGSGTRVLLNPDQFDKKVIYLLKPLQRYSGSGRNLQPNRENVGLPGSGSANKFESGSRSEILDRMHSKCFASALISVRIRIMHASVPDPDVFEPPGSASGIVCQSLDMIPYPQHTPRQVVYGI